MAGNYPDIPAPRIPYDRNGTGFSILDNNSGAVSNLSSDFKALQAGTAYLSLPDSPYSRSICFIFPTHFDLIGYFLQAPRPPTTSAIQVSQTSTNGQDGVWENWATNPPVNTSFSPQHRTGIQTPTAKVGIKALRINCNGGFVGLSPYFGGIHLYGKQTDTTSRLELWHPTLNQSLNATPAHLDWGDRPRGIVETKTFRVKNLSAGFTAADVIVSLEGLTNPSAAWAALHSFRIGLGSYTPNLTIETLAPGEVSPVIEIRQELNDTIFLGLGQQRVIAQATTWT